MIPLFKVFMSPEAKVIVGETLESGYIGQATKVETFEAMLRDWFQNNYVNTVNAATSALHMAIHMCKHEEGVSPERDEIITTPLTCTATNWPILANGLKIKWADVNVNTCNIDIEDVARKVNPRTLAIMVVHWGGLSCDLDKLAKIQDRCEAMYGFRPNVIEDSAHAWGAMYKGKMLGNHGNMSIFSFQAIKHLTTGDGGLLVCPTPEMHNRAKLLRWYGLDRNSSADFRCEQNIKEWGYKFHMNDIAASIGIANMKHSLDIVQKHQDNAEYYNKALNSVSGVTLLTHDPNAVSTYWVYTIRVEDRTNFVRKMKEKGIAVSQVHDRNDKHACVQDARAILPGLDVLSKDMICIPCGWWVTEKDREYIAGCINEGW